MATRLTLTMRPLGAIAVVAAIAAIVALTLRVPREHSTDVDAGDRIDSQSRSAAADASTEAQNSGAMQGPAERASSLPAEHGDAPREKQVSGAAPLQPNRSSPAPVSGRLIVQQVDWTRLKRGSPIPREMPAQESDHPEDAGFARQWADRALAGSPAVTFIHKGESLQAGALQLALPIVGESKRPDDTWAYGVEHELRTRLTKALGDTGPAPLRIFCNAHGCLCYFEGITTRHPLQLAASIMDEPWARDFGIEPLSQFVTNGGGTGPRENWWELMIVTRARPEHPPN
jgi:hypothetical protein